MSPSSGDPPPRPSFPTRRSSDLPVVPFRTKFLFHDHGEPVRVCPYPILQLSAFQCQNRLPKSSNKSELSPVLAEYCHRPLAPLRSEEHTSELQSRENLVCRLLLE